MDRIQRAMAGCGLVVLLAASGCKSTPPEVPPGRPYTPDGQQVPPVSFSSDAHPSTNGAGQGMTMTPGGIPGMPGGGNQGLPGNPSSSTGQFATPGVSGSTYGATPTDHGYGPPGSSTLGNGTAPSAPASGATSSGLPQAASTPPAPRTSPSSSFGAPGGGGEPGLPQ